MLVVNTLTTLFPPGVPTCFSFFFTDLFFLTIASIRCLCKKANKSACKLDTCFFKFSMRWICRPQRRTQASAETNTLLENHFSCPGRCSRQNQLPSAPLRRFTA